MSPTLDLQMKVHVIRLIQGLYLDYLSNKFKLSPAHADKLDLEIDRDNFQAILEDSFLKESARKEGYDLISGWNSFLKEKKYKLGDKLLPLFKINTSQEELEPKISAILNDL